MEGQNNAKRKIIAQNPPLQKAAASGGTFADLTKIAEVETANMAGRRAAFARSAGFVKRGQ